MASMRCACRSRQLPRTSSLLGLAHDAGLARGVARAVALASALDQSIGMTRKTVNGPALAIGLTHVRVTGVALVPVRVLLFMEK